MFSKKARNITLIQCCDHRNRVFCSAKSAYKDCVVKADDLVKERGIQSEEITIREYERRGSKMEIGEMSLRRIKGFAR